MIYNHYATKESLIPISLLFIRVPKYCGGSLMYLVSSLVLKLHVELICKFRESGSFELTMSFVCHFGCTPSFWLHNNSQTQ
jgi:hypothetical protein